MHPLIDPEFHNVAVIKTRPGIRANPAMTDSLCWNCATANGCDGLRENCDNGHHYDLFTCPSCRRMVPWSSGGTDSLDCADCWALTEERRTMEEKQAADVLPAKSEEDQIVDNVRKRTAQDLTFPVQAEKAAENIRAQPAPAYGPIGGSKSKSRTKALEKIIKRQEKRIVELATKLGRLECVTDTDDEHWKRLLAATNSKGASEAIAKVEKWAELCIPAPPKYYPSASAPPSAEHCPVPVTDLA